MKPNIYDLLNNIETDCQAYDSAPLPKAEADGYKRQFRSRTQTGRQGFPGRGLAVAACIAVCLLALGTGPFRTEVRAAAKTLTYNIGELLGTNENLTPYENIVNYSVTNADVTITLNSVILEDDVLYVSTTETKEPQSDLNMEEVSLLGSLFVNGKYIENSSSGVLEPSEDGNGRESLIGYNLGRHFKKEDMDVELILEDASHTLDGNWKFEFHANGEQLSEQTQEIATDIHYSLPDGTQVDLTAYTSSPIGQKIYYKTAGSSDYDMKLEGTDDLGNPVSFYVSHATKSEGRFNIDRLTGLISPDAGALTLTPYISPSPKKSGRTESSWQQAGEAFTIGLK